MDVHINLTGNVAKSLVIESSQDMESGLNQYAVESCQTCGLLLPVDDDLSFCPSCYSERTSDNIW